MGLPENGYENSTIRLADGRFTHKTFMAILQDSILTSYAKEVHLRRNTVGGVYFNSDKDIPEYNETHRLCLSYLLPVKKRKPSVSHQRVLDFGVGIRGKICCS